MISSINNINENINNQEWGIEIGHPFERLIYNSLIKTLNLGANDDIKLKKTSAANDGGKDFVIKSKVNLKLFDIDISLKGKKEISIYIECKSSNNDLISYEKVSKNSIIAGQDRVDYFILVTNKTISPFTFYSIDENSKLYGYEFILVDQFLLHNFLDKHNLNGGNYIQPPHIPEIGLSYQTSKSFFEETPCIELFLMCRNYADKDIDCSLNLFTDRNWRIRNFDNIFVVEKDKTKCFKFIIFKKYSDGLDDLLIKVNINKFERIIEIKNDFINYNFELPLTGEAHKNIIDQISESIFTKDNFVWFNLYGEAGIGKTRVINEICKKINEKGINILSYLCSNNCKNNFERLKNRISQNFKKTISSNNFIGFFKEIEDKYEKTVLIIEDIHNADKEFIAMLSKLSNNKDKKNIQLVLITAGRDDYTVFNEDYFSLLDEIKEKTSNNIFSYIIKPFKDNECKMLIKQIIKDIPNNVMKKLYSSSQNNPFYLVQFIEYLLEINIVNLLNRNTVGIPNIQTFAQKLYIPVQIENLLKRRLSNLKMSALGQKLCDFLFMASMYGIEFPRELFYLYFSDDELDNTNVLFKSHFINLSGKKDTLKFDHETIYLFFREQRKSLKLCQEICNKPQIFELYPDTTKGIIYCITGQFSLAEKELQNPITEIKNMSNVSSENISPEYFDTLNYIYEYFKYNKDYDLMKRTLLCKVYIAMHNLAMGRALNTFIEVNDFKDKNHSEDQHFITELKQLEASFYLSVGLISKSEGLMNELIAEERQNPVIFNDETRYNLYERAASLSIHLNHLEPALAYNHLSFELAEKMNNNKLKALSKINEAKAYFFIDAEKSLNLIKEADSYLKEDFVLRINCHNQLGMLTTKIILSDTSDDEIKDFINQAEKLLKLSLDIKYPLDIIRSHYILAILNFISNPKDIENCKRHIECGIEASIRFGILKIVPSIYCLKALVAIYEKQNKDYIAQIFNTMIDYLSQQDLLFLGNLDFTYANIILLTNYLIFLEENAFENKMYEFLQRITYYGYSAKCDFQCDKHPDCQYTCAKDLSLFKQNYDIINDGSLLLVDPKYKFKRIYKNYFFPLSL